MSLPATVGRSLAASIDLARERIRRAPRHVAFTWLLQAIVLLVLGSWLPGVLVEDLFSALTATAVIAALNALVRPIIVVLTLPLTVATFGLLSLLINSSMVVLAAPLVPGLEVSGFLAAFSLALVLTVATTVVNVVLAIDEDETFYDELAHRIEGTEVRVEGPRPAGLAIIQIDGLAAPILRNAIRVGTVPRMASWVRSGAYVLTEWECPPPSQTSASQAGILHGNNDGIPAFRWYEKGSGRLLVSNHPVDATEIERRISDGKGLLAPAGSSVGNLFSGDARRSAFVMSRMGDTVGQLDVDAFSLYFMDPASFIRTLVLGIGEFLKELIESRRQRIQDIQPRVRRGLSFAFLRAATNVVLRDLNTTFVVRSMFLAAPVIYTDFTDYDEIAHHAGPERIESLRALTGIDGVIASLARAAEHAPRDYHFVLLSDHGQSQGTTFAQRYGRTLEGLIRDFVGGQRRMVAATGRTELYGPVNALLTELAQRPGVTGRATSAALRGRRVDGAVDLGRRDERISAEERPDVVVCASGNLANVYFNASHQRMGATQIDATYPGLLAALVQHPGVGFVMVASEEGSLVLGTHGVRYLVDDRVEGENPLRLFGERAADHLRRMDGFGNIGDLLINSSFDPELGEVAAFEELVGSHGGMGGPQTRPFLLHPAGLIVDVEPLVGATAVHEQLERWARRLDVAAAVESAEPAAAAREARGLRWLAAWYGLLGTLLLLLGAALFVADLAGEVETIDAPLGGSPLLVGVVAAVVGLIGLVTLATGWGLCQQRRWAWATALVISAVQVLQFIMAVASGGFAGVVSYGIMTAGTSLIVIWYLTRPHVAAAFGRRGRARRGLARRGPAGTASRTTSSG